jgi:hypothetical protein
MFGGNSNWRGPVWLPVNALLIRGLLNLYQFYGDNFRVNCPTDLGNHMTLFEVAKEIARRLSSIFPRDADGSHPVYGGSKKVQEDPNWRDYILFYEYFHGDTHQAIISTISTCLPINPFLGLQHEILSDKLLAVLYTSSRDAKSLAVFRQCIQSILYITKRPFDGGLESLLPVPECVVTLSGQD